MAVTNTLGMTETTGLGVTNAGINIAKHPDAVGPPMMTVEAEIRDELGRPVPEGEVGEICLRTASVFLGYWDNPAATGAAVEADGWYHTGDYGRISDGLVYMDSRRRDMIIRGGENIYPIEIEHRLVAHPAILEAAVIGSEHAARPGGDRRGRRAFRARPRSGRGAGVGGRDVGGVQGACPCGVPHLAPVHGVGQGDEAARTSGTASDPSGRDDGDVPPTTTADSTAVGAAPRSARHAVGAAPRSARPLQQSDDDAASPHARQVRGSRCRSCRSARGGRSSGSTALQGWP